MLRILSNIAYAFPRSALLGNINTVRINDLYELLLWKHLRNEIKQKIQNSSAIEMTKEWMSVYPVGIQSVGGWALADQMIK